MISLSIRSRKISHVSPRPFAAAQRRSSSNKLAERSARLHLVVVHGGGVAAPRTRVKLRRCMRGLSLAALPLPTQNPQTETMRNKTERQYRYI